MYTLAYFPKTEATAGTVHDLPTMILPLSAQPYSATTSPDDLAGSHIPPRFPLYERR